VLGATCYVRCYVLGATCYVLVLRATRSCYVLVSPARFTTPTTDHGTRKHQHEHVAHRT